MRLFVAVWPTDEVLDAIAALPRPEVAGLRWTTRDQWHVTLRFLGEVLDPAPVAAALDEACRGRPALPCVVEGLGAFPAAKHARVAWAGVRAAGVEALAEAVVNATAAFGEPPEGRRFVAHVTLARLPNPVDLRSLVDSHKGTLLAEGTLDRVVLFRSRLGPGGARHEALHEARLG